MAEFIQILKALSDETRLQILKLLLNHDYCVRALARRLDISESAVSQHLKVLRHAGVVKGEKRGYFTHYWVDKELLKDTAQKIIQLCDDAVSSDERCNKTTSTNHLCCRKEKNKNV